MHQVPGADNRMIPKVTLRKLHEGEVGVEFRQPPKRAIACSATFGTNKGADVNARRSVGGEEAADMEMPSGPRAFCMHTHKGVSFSASPAIYPSDEQRAQLLYCE